MVSNNIIGRASEVKVLNKMLKSKKAEFVVIYGRRRVGKTYLIKEYFDNQFDFYMTGVANADMAYQLQHFHESMRDSGEQGEHTIPSSWQEAFLRLRHFCSELPKNRKTLIFIDELPWLDTPKSNFLWSLEYFWNSWASTQKNILLIGCGSSASWMINKLINNTGGLHNRVTRRIKLNPFNLHETEQLLIADGHQLDRYQILQLYMVTGGIPYYLSYLNVGYSAAQNINMMCFPKRAFFRSEFYLLFRSLFYKADIHQSIVEVLAKKKQGLTRTEIMKNSHLTNGGRITRVLDELEESGFIRRYTPFGKKSRNTIYRLSDYYSSFYLRFIKDSNPYDDKVWLQAMDNPSIRAWQGYAFEQICMDHIPQIKQSLGIDGVHTTSASWRSVYSDPGAQVDLLIDRRDHVINLCEIKYSINPYRITKSYDANLRNKIGAFQNETKTNKAIFLTMITTFGVQENKYYHTVQNHITMDALFEPIRSTLH